MKKMAKFSFVALMLVVNTLSSGTHAQNKRQLRLNGTSSCEKFPDFCPTECTAIDARACLVCQCHVVTNKTEPSTSSNTGGATGQNQNSGTSASSANNMAGCPKLAANCNFDCLAIGNTGCIECTCTNGGSPMSLTGGATLTSSGSGSQSGQGSQGTMTGVMNNTTSMTNGQSPFSINAGSGTGSSSASGGSGGIGTSAQASYNINGCPAFPSTCDASCTTLDRSSGCPICKCPSGGSNNSSASTSMTSNSLASSSSSSNLNGCPPFSAGCSADCVDLDSAGCPICKCHHSGSGPSNGASSSLNSHQMSNGASSNANGCPAFLSNCAQECVNLDGHGCPICMCDGKTNGTGSSTSSMGNNNGCPVFPVNCRSDCVSLDSLGCPLCSCTTGSGHTMTNSSSTSGSQTASHGSSNNNGCPSFPTNCKTDCVELSALGCPICTCTSSGSGSVSGTSYHNEYNHVSQGSMSNSNGCPAFRSSCPAECTTTNDNGCPVCTCSGSSSGGHSSGSSPSGTTPSSSSGGSNAECPTLIPNCNTACLWTDDYGCVLCNGDCNDKYVKQQTGSGNSSTNTQTNTSTSATSGSSTGSGTSGGVICPAYDKSCRADCASFDQSGCLICTCPGKTSGSGGLSGGNINGCEAFDTSCPSGCAAVDKSGCLICTCSSNSSGNTGTGGQNGTGSSTGSGITSGTSGGTGTGSTGAVTCPAFDGAHCNPTCIGLDMSGCLSCDCGTDVTTPSTQPGSSSGTHAPFVPGGGDVTTFAPGLAGNNNGAPGGQSGSGTGGDLTTFAPGIGGTGTGSGTQGGQTGAGNTNSCSPYDTNCPPGCTELDAHGCLSCTCSSQNNTSSSGAGTSTGNGNGNNCPAFDTSCTAGCTNIDAVGCLTCTCSGVSHPTSPSVTLSPLLSATTFAPIVPGSGTGTGNTGTGSASGSTGNGSGCPTFDTNCSASCVSLDSMGCMTCSCSGGGSSGNNTNGGGATGTSGTGTGCPAYDTTCPASCTSLDAMGCPTCSCSGGKNPAPGTGNGSQGGSGNANSCPPVDIMSCDPKCVQLDTHGCVLCTCKATTARPQITTSSAPITTQKQAIQTTTVKTHTCPKFDESCPRNCIAIDTRGCLGCTCSATTQVLTNPPPTLPIRTQPPSTQPPTTHASTTQTPTTKAPTTQAPMTKAPTTVSNLQTSASPKPITKTTSSAPGVCPPIRCLYPCDAGVTLGADNCPICKCRTNVSTTPTSV